MQKSACRIPVCEQRMDLILSGLGQKRPIFVALVESEQVTGQNVRVIGQTYAESLADICAAIDDLQLRHSKCQPGPGSPVSSLKIMVRTKPSKSAEEVNQSWSAMK
jgi:hypothetical protein